jgi:hypothetical protein
VPYDVEFVEPVREFLSRIEGLTDEDRTTIVAAVIEELSRDADRFLALYPLAHESLSFRYDYPHPKNDPMRVCQLDFIVDGSQMDAGKVTVVYVECSFLYPEE